MKIIKKIIKNFAPYFFVKKYLEKKGQVYFENQHYSALRGMNIGCGGDLNASGEKFILNIIEKNYKEKDDLITIFDVGANKGMWTLLANEIFGNRAKIYSFEPSQDTYKLLTDNINNLAINGDARLYNFGFGDKNINQILYSNEEGSGLASVYNRKLDHFDIAMTKQEEIKIRTIDDFCIEEDIKKINFLKLDIEGNEFNALIGAKNIIEGGG